MDKEITLVLVVPKQGCKVRDPETKQHLAESGEVREKNLFWIRREMEGSVELKPIEKKTTTSKK